MEQTIPVEKDVNVPIAQPPEQTPIVPDNVDRPEPILDEDNIGPSYMERRAQAERANSPAAELLRKHTTPEEFEKLIPYMGMFDVGTGGILRINLDIGGGKEKPPGPKGQPEGQTPNAGTGTIIAGVDLKTYAADPRAIGAVHKLYQATSQLASPEELDAWIQKTAPGSPINAQMIVSAAEKYRVEPALLAALLQNESWMGTAGLALKTKNPGNVGGDNPDPKWYFDDWAKGVEVAAHQLARRKTDGSQPAPMMASGLAGGARGGFRAEPDMSTGSTVRDPHIPMPDVSAPSGPGAHEMSLSLLAAGWKPEEIEAEIGGGIHEPLYSPPDLLADVLTGGMTAAGRSGISAIAKGSVKEGAEVLGKAVARDVGTGALAGGAMSAADAAGAGPLVQMLSGLVGPTATMALLQMPRKGLATYLGRLEATNPETYKNLVKAVTDNPDSKLAQGFHEVIGKAKELALSHEVGAVGNVGTVKERQAEGLNPWTGKPTTQADLDARAADVVKRWNEANPAAPAQTVRDVPIEFIRKVQSEQMGTAWLNPKDPKSPATLKEKGSFENNPKSLFILGKKNDELESLILQDKLSKPLEKYSININQERLQTPEDINKLIDAVAQKLPIQINKARRGKVDAEAVKQLAADLGWSEETLLARRRGQAFNAEQVMAARWIMVDSADKLMDMAKRIRAGENSDEMLGLFRERLSRHVAIQAQVSGMTAEAGRALGAFNIMAKEGDLRLQEIKGVIESSGGRGNLESMADTLVGLANANGGKVPLAAVNAAAKKLQKATTADMLLEAWIMGLLSGPQTHAVNMLSNALTAIWQVPERKFAAWVSQSPIGSGEIQAAEATAQAFGLTEGFRQGLTVAGKALKSGETSDIIGKIETPRRAISSTNLAQTWLGQKLPPSVLETGGPVARGIDLLGEGIRLPGRFLTAEDELFKSIGYMMELNAQAFRQASSEGLSGDLLAKRITELVQNPPDNIKLASIDAAHYVTFTQPLGKTGRMIQSATNSLPALKIIMPFVRTPVNILKFTLERTPLAPIMANVRADIMAGGARRDLVLARIGLGSTIMATASAMAAGGAVTGGGPADKDMREVLKRKGWQPYSVKIGDTYYSYSRVDFPGNLFAMAADSTEIMGQVGETDASRIAGAAIVSISQNVLSKTYCRGLSDFFAVFSEAQKTENSSRGEAYIRRLIGSVVPSFLAGIERTTDPTVQDVSRYKGFDAVIASIKSRVPGYSKDLPPQRNLWGEPIVYEGGLGPDIASPIYTNSDKPSPIDDEMLRLKVAVKMPSPVVDGVELTPHEYDRYVFLAGNGLKNPGDGLGCKDALNRLVQSPDYQRQSDGDPVEGFEGGKAMMIKSIVNAYRQMAKAKMLDQDGEFPDLNRVWMDTQKSKARAMQPKF